MSRVVCFLLIGFIWVGNAPLMAELPVDAEQRVTLIGKPVSLDVQPTSIALAGPRTNLM